MVSIMGEAIRTFMSVDIEDEPLLARIGVVQGRLDRDAAKMKLVKRENLHFTWRFFGDTSMARLMEIHDELSSITFKPFPIQVHGVSAFPSIRRPRVIWIGVSKNAEKMKDLKTSCDNVLLRLGYPRESKFTPHATIARVRSVRNRERLLMNLESLKHEHVGTMIVKSLRMKKSTLTPSGPIYQTLWEIVAE